jgi:diguanylate cyclase (GGDEF)-like protein/PAS domain S-box-containing protein
VDPHAPELLGALPVAALVVDAAGVVERGNDHLAALLGTEADAVGGRPLTDVVPRPGALLEGHGLALTLEARRANGNPVRVHALAAPTADGRRLCLLAEAAREGVAGEVQLVFDAAFEHAPIGMAIFDGDGRYARVNAALCRMLDRPADELLGRRDNLLTHPDDRQADVEAAWEILDGRADTFQCEKRFLRPDGSVVWCIANLVYLRDERGDGLGWVGQFQDLTARRDAEERVRLERDYTRAILATMDDGFALVREGRVVEVNDAMCRLTGLSREACLGTSFPYPWTRPEDAAAQERLRRAADRGERVQADIVLLRADGTTLDVSITLQDATGLDGRPLGRLATLRDVSEGRRQQRELQRLARRDALTGLHNRRAFHEELDAAAAAARAAGRPLSLVLLDLDRFKQVNDRHGHPAGDEVLAGVADRLREVAGPDALLARLGGEELAWVLPGASGPTAFAAAEHARRAVEGRPFAAVGRVTLSAGVCELGQAGDAGELYRLADVALYWAKQRGRNLVVRWTPDPELALDARGLEVAAERDRQLQALRAVARLVDEHRHGSPGHAERVAELAALLAGEAGWAPGRVARLREAALLHDVGKVALPAGLLRKPAALDPEERALVQTHAAVSADMVADVLDAEQVGWVRAHHERWDGAGYPHGLAGEAIPDGGRLIAVADTWDAMVNGRSYRAARPLDDALDELRRCAGGQLEPDAARRLELALTPSRVPAATGA